MSGPTPRRVADQVAGFYVGVAVGLVGEGRIDLAVIAAVLVFCAVTRVREDVPGGGHVGPASVRPPTAEQVPATPPRVQRTANMGTGSGPGTPPPPGWSR